MNKLIVVGLAGLLTFLAFGATADAAPRGWGWRGGYYGHRYARIAPPVVLAPAPYFAPPAPYFAPRVYASPYVVRPYARVYRPWRGGWRR